jgi:hypothetical protein
MTHSSPSRSRWNAATLLILGITVLTVLIIASFVYFFNVSATQWTPVPTYTATFNATQAVAATRAAGSLTPPATPSPVPTLAPTVATTPLPPTVTLAPTSIATAEATK